MNNEYEQFGKRLKELRLERGLTQETLGKILMVNKSSISRYEKNQQIPEISALHKLANIFEVSLDYLLGKSEYRNTDEFELAEKIIEAFEHAGISKEDIDLDVLDKALKIYKVVKI